MTDRLSIFMRPQRLWELLKQTAIEWSEDKVPRLGAALAYYTVFSAVPLLVVIITIIGLVFGSEAAQGYVIDQLSELMGSQSAEAIKEMIHHASRPQTGLWATVIATGTLLLGASGLFGQLQEALNDIWGVKAKPGSGIRTYLKARFISLATVFGTGFLLLVSLVISAGLAAFGRWYQGWLPAPQLVLQLLEVILSLVVITGLFAMMFKFLPDVEIAWGDVWIGAALTALLFSLGKMAIGLYIGNSDIGSAYGSAGSLVIFLVWVYYSTQILLFGAEFTQVYANMEGARVVPSAYAVAIDARKASSARPSLQTACVDTARSSEQQEAWEPAVVLLVGTAARLFGGSRGAGNHKAGPPSFKRSLLVLGAVVSARWIGRRIVHALRTNGMGRS